MEKKLLEDDSWIDIVMDDVYDTFYRDEEEAKVVKASQDMNLSITKEKFLAMLEFEKAIVKDYTKLVVTDGMVDYDNGKRKEAKHHHLKVNKDDKGKGKLVDDNGKGKVHDIQNRVGSLEVDLARAIKAKQREKESKKVKESKKIREAKKAKESKLAKQAKKAMEAELKAKEAKKAKKEKESELKAKEEKKEK
uniref:Uncharacterized protein n=1 Tax=Tanacetum cinerariifolium TaxID=118510 RepID=A0A699HYP3_TANCI|nr:hypothetical protein [Tanacetum cinerariifolium]